MIQRIRLLNQRETIDRIMIKHDNYYIEDVKSIYEFLKEVTPAFYNFLDVYLIRYNMPMLND
jgi:hypothetical protein